MCRDTTKHAPDTPKQGLDTGKYGADTREGAQNSLAGDGRRGAKGGNPNNIKAQAHRAKSVPRGRIRTLCYKVRHGKAASRLRHP